MVFFFVFGLFFLLLISVPVGISLGLVCSIYVIITGIPISIIAQQFLQGISSFILIAIPLFMFASQVMNSSKVTEKLLNMSNSFFGHITGSLAQVNVFMSMIFAGMSGSSLADTAGIGKALIPSMIKEGYDKDFSAAITAASAVCGPIIPPSIPMVITGSIAGMSVAKLFLGGAIPGVLFGILLLIYSYIISLKKGYPKHNKATLKEIIVSVKAAFLPLLMPLILLGGIFSGIFTATEAASVAVGYGLFLAVLIYRNLNWKKFLDVVYDVFMQTASIMFVVGAANVYGYILTREKIPQLISQSLLSITANETLILLFIVIAVLIIGCFLSATPTLMLTLPMVIPMMGQFGFDRLHFFVIVTVAACMGTITPPVGLNLYVASSIADAPIEKTIIAILPMIGILLFVTILLIFFPSLVTYLPCLLLG
jgi:tripartite ATP-independent transporter DctM subunit